MSDTRLVQDSRIYLLYNRSYSQFCVKILVSLLHWQQRSIRGKFQ